MTVGRRTPDDRYDPALLALLCALDVFGEQAALPFDLILRVVIDSSTVIAGAELLVEAAAGPVTVAAIGDAHARAVVTRPVIVERHELATIHLHLAEGADPGAEAAAAAAADAAAELLGALVGGLPAFGLRPDDPVGVFLLDRDMTVGSVTPSVEGIVGYQVDEFVGRPGLELLHPDDRDIAALAFSRTRSSGGRRLAREWRILGPGDRPVPVELQADTRLDDPRVQGVVYRVRAVAVRDPLNRTMSAHMRILEEIARGRPVQSTLDLVAAFLDENVQGDPLLFVTDDPDVDAIPPSLRLVSASSVAPSLTEQLRGTQVIVDNPAPWTSTMRRKESVVYEHLDEGTWPEWSGRLSDAGYRAAYAYPFRAEQRNALGAVAVLRPRPGVPDANDAHALKVAAGLARMAIEHDLAAVQLARRATQDELTSLPNRVFVVDLVEHVLSHRRADQLVAVIFIDLDRFKLVNDSYGHSTGDQLLVLAAERLRATAPDGTTVARFGGDEFVLLLPDIAGPHEALAAADRLATALHEPFTLHGHELRLTASMGLAFAPPDQPIEANALLRDADTAVNRAKDQGRDRAEIFDDALRESALDRLTLEHDLRAALERDELQVHYQPEVDLRSGAVIGMEALVRWRHPARGLLFPGAFIEMAEDTGLVIPLGEAVLRQAAAAAAHWNHGHSGLDRYPVGGTQRLLDVPDPEGRPLTVWVNVAMRQLEPAGRTATPLVKLVRELLDEHGLDPAALGFEVTERDLVRDLDETVTLLRSLADVGVRLAVDDFGTGYASLTYLKHLPVDVVKIDGSFVAGLGADPGDEAIVAAVLGLGASLGKEVVAEGVETAGQRDALCFLGCRRAQGYLFARPAPLSTFDPATGSGRS